MLLTLLFLSNYKGDVRSM